MKSINRNKNKNTVEWLNGVDSTSASRSYSTPQSIRCIAYCIPSRFLCMCDAAKRKKIGLHFTSQQRVYRLSNASDALCRMLLQYLPAASSIAR